MQEEKNNKVKKIVDDTGNFCEENNPRATK